MKYINLKSRPKRFFLKKFLPVFILSTIIIIVALIVSSLSGPGQVFRYVFQSSLLKSTNGNINVLLLGNAGGLHQGAHLTDTVMVASYNLKKDQLFLISLPRDLWIDAVSGKLNTVYEIGESKEGGLIFAKKVIGDVLGISIHYGLRMDFTGFVKAIDQVGGVNIGVERNFDDFYYPIEGRENDLCGWEEEEVEFDEGEAKKLNIEAGKRRVLIKDGKIATDSAEESKGFEYFSCRFEHIFFNQGATHMDGETALKFVRSRHGTDGEGSDFSRSKRQQKVIEAFKNKVLSLETLVNTQKIAALAQTFGKSLDTDIHIPEILEFYKFSKKIQLSQNFILSSSGKDSLLINPPVKDYGGSYVLIPREGDFKMIKDYVKKIIKGEIENEASTSARSGN